MNDNIVLYQQNSWELTAGMADNSVDVILTDPPYDTQVCMIELERICKGNIIMFSAPEHPFFEPDERAFWIKTPSTKNYIKHLGRFVEIILIRRKGSTFNVMHWSQMTGVYDDRLVYPPKHPYEKPLTLIERLLRLYSNPGDLVYDPFMGCGTTGIGCINLERRFIGCERDVSTFDLAYQEICKNVR